MEAVSCHFMVGCGGSQLLEYISKQTLPRSEYLEELILFQNLKISFITLQPLRQ